MNKIVLASIVSMGLLTFNFAAKKRSEELARPTKTERNFEKRLLDHVANVRQKIGKNKSYNNDFAFFIDMKIHSGKNRFFIYDFKANKIVD